MAVLSYMREITKMQVYMTAETIYDQIADLIAREMGHKKKIYNFDTYAKNEKLSEEDKETITNILNNNNIDYDSFKITRKLPDSFIERYQDILFDDCIKLINNIIMGNEVFPNNTVDLVIRESYFKRARGNCKSISNTLVRYARQTGIQIEKFQYITENIAKEIKLINGLINSDKERFPEMFAELSEHYKNIRDNLTDEMLTEIMQLMELQETNYK